MCTGTRDASSLARSSWAMRLVRGTVGVRVRVRVGLRVSASVKARGRAGRRASLRRPHRTRGRGGPARGQGLGSGWLGARVRLSGQWEGFGLERVERGLGGDETRGEGRGGVGAHACARRVEAGESRCDGDALGWRLTPSTFQLLHPSPTGVQYPRLTRAAAPKGWPMASTAWGGAAAKVYAASW